MEIKTGFGINVDSLKKCINFEKMGVTGVTLSVDLNRNFKKLKNIVKSSNLKLVLLGTLTCFNSCHKLNSCMNSLSHTSNLEENSDIPINFPLLSCFYEKIREPWKILSTPFIRPEDVEYYEKIGIDEIKLTDRFNSTDTLVKKVEAYINGKYDGNLLDLLSFYLLVKDGSFKKRKLYIPKKMVSSILDIEKKLELSKSPSIYIDNEKLNGFLEFFKSNDIDCGNRVCKKCSWCIDYGKKSIKFHEKEIEEFYDRFLKFSKEFLSLRKI